jgi:DNA transposition AAA+ family ATPase
MDKQALKKYIDNLIERGSSASELARRCGISDAAMSQFRAGKYAANDDVLAEKIASGLYFYENSNTVVDTVTSYRQVKTDFMIAKAKSRWFCISSRSGSGKTQSLIDLYNVYGDGSVIYIKCRKWSGRKFLEKLAQAMGKRINRYMDNDTILDMVIEHINSMAAKKPILLIDDAGKLSNTAMCTLIPLYDDTKGRMGCIVAGTETLEYNIKRNAGRVEGYSEIDGRFKHFYRKLLGATKKDVINICLANGVQTKEEAEAIWGKIPKTQKYISEESTRKVWFADDLRELAGMIDDVVIKQELNSGELNV